MMPALAGEGLRFRTCSGWGIFESQGGPRRGDPLRGPLGRPGLWRFVHDTRRRTFELPPSIVPRREIDPVRFARLADWAAATEGGRLDGDWSPPPATEVRGWLPEQALTLQVGSMALQGSLIHEDRRLAIDFPIVSSIPDDLPRARRAWLRELLRDAQRRWRMVRIGSQGGTALAQLDLSGAPRDFVEPLVRIGVDALRHVVSSLMEPADFLVNGAAGCRAVEVPPSKPETRRKP